MIESLRGEILRTAEDQGFRVVAGVFMPDHLHLLVEGTSSQSDFKQLMKLLRMRTAVEFGKHDNSGCLWQDGYYERVLRADESTPMVVEYIVTNPVTAKLVRCVDDYPYTWVDADFGYPAAALMGRT